MNGEYKIILVNPLYDGVVLCIMFRDLNKWLMEQFNSFVWYLVTSKLELSIYNGYAYIIDPTYRSLEYTNMPSGIGFTWKQFYFEINLPWPMTVGCKSHPDKMVSNF